MNLLDIKAYIQEKKTVNLLELSVRFGTDPDNIRHMLQHWIRK